MDEEARKVIRGQHLHTAFHFPAGLSTLCCEAKHPCKFFSVPCVHMESCHLRVQEKWLISPPQTRSVQVHVTSEDLADSWGPIWSLSCLLWPDINRICKYMNQLWKKASPGKKHEKIMLILLLTSPRLTILVHDLLLPCCYLPLQT